MLLPAEITVARLFETPQRALFAAFTEPALLEGWLCTRAESDPGDDGELRLELESENSGTHLISGRYTTFVRPERLVMAWRYEGPLWEGVLELPVEVTFTAWGRATEVTLTQRGLSPQQASLAETGWKRAFERLAELIGEEHTRALPV